MLKSRKKLLLSSVAMLLVALIALGSATFAWFSMNRIVTTKNMNITSSAAKGLLITNDRGANWDTSADFAAYSAKFNPVSVGYTSDSDAYQAFGTPYYVEDNNTDGKAETDNIGGKWKGDATIPTISGLAGTGDNASKAANRNNFFAVYEVGVKSSGDAITNVTLKADIKDTGNYARVAIFDNGVQAPATIDYSTAVPEKVYGSESSPKAVTAISGTAFSAASAQKLEAFTAGGADPLAYADTVKTDLTAPANSESATTTGHYFTIVVWFEGEDTQCVDTAQSKDLQLALQFSY